jgi:hypothetical protein
MAHIGEASSVIEKFKLTKKTPEFFVGENLLLLITGEGPFEAAVKTALLLPQFPIKEIINLGIAGTLDTELEVGEIHPVRTIYLVQDFKPTFKTFKSHEKGIDCITSFERILDPDKAQKLKGVATLVDREAWGIAMVAKTNGTDFKSFKIISDIAGTLDACELIKEKATDFSKALANFLGDYLRPITKVEIEISSFPGFYFTFTTEHKFKNLLTKLAIKENSSEAEVLATLPLSDLREKKLLQKERSRILMEEMENRIDPTRKILNDKKSQWLKSFEKEGLKVQTDPQWENPMVAVTIEATNDEELNLKLEALKHLSLKPFTDLMNGHLHVE